MKRNSLFIAALFFLYTSAIAQTTDSIVGKWKFKDIYNAEKIDSSSLKMLRSMFADMTLYFKSNRHYKINMFKKEEGNWNYDNLTKKLSMNANKGTSSQMGVINAENNILIVSIAKDKAFILERTTIMADDETEEVLVKVELASATAKQICKKWWLVKRDIPNRTAEQSKTVTDMVGESYFNFKADNTYEAQTLNIKVAGKWAFGEGNRSLLLTIENTTITWKIKSVQENELILLRGNTTETWTLSTNH